MWKESATRAQHRLNWDLKASKAMIQRSQRAAAPQPAPETRQTRLADQEPCSPLSNMQQTHQMYPHCPTNWCLLHCVHIRNMVAVDQCFCMQRWGTYTRAIVRASKGAALFSTVYLTPNTGLSANVECIDTTDLATSSSFSGGSILKPSV